MARILTYCDSPTAPTGFGRSSKHVLYALHEAGHEIVQLAVNHDPSTEDEIPWKVYSPSSRGQDPYGLQDLVAILVTEKPFDLFWTTFDPEVPWSYAMPGVEPRANVLQVLQSLRATNPGFKMLLWVPIDGGPLSDFELSVVCDKTFFDVVATMSPHVHDLVNWTFKLKGLPVDVEEVKKRIEVVPHGVDLELYRIASDEERRAAKAELGYPSDCFLVVQVERNQQRKDPWRALEILERLRLRHKNVFLYQHMDENEETQNSLAGFRLRDLAWRYGLKADVDVRWRQRPYSEEELVSVVYAAADVVLSTSLGEGFQYPLWEALACGRRVVAPNDSARKAWLSHTPGAFLYGTDEHGTVVRGGYNRRMGRPDGTDAARIIGKMVEGRQKYAECGGASRAWVGRTAPVQAVRNWWVATVEEQVKALRAEREAGGVRVLGGEEGMSDYVVGIREHPGIGDVVMMAPALRAFKAKAAAEGKTVTLALPPGKNYLMAAQWLEASDYYQAQPAIPFDQLGKELLNVSSLWKPVHRNGWSDPSRHRTEVVAEFLGVADRLEPLVIPVPADKAKQADAAFRERFGVDQTSCVVIAGQSGIRDRDLPEGIVKQVVEATLARDLTPIVIGTRPAGIQRIGALDLTGQIDFPTMVLLLGTAGAVIATDSAPAHLAAVQGTPLVACFPTYPGASRVGRYCGAIEIVEPGVERLNGEAWPPGEYPTNPPGSWASLLTTRRIMAALDALLNEEALEDGPGAPIVGEGDSPGLGAPKVITAADLGLPVGKEADE